MRLTHDILSVKGDVLWLGAYERGEPVPLVSGNETLTLDVPGNFFADLLAGSHLTADYQTLSSYEIISGRLMPHGRVAVAAPPWSWTPDDCQWWRARLLFAVHPLDRSGGST